MTCPCSFLRGGLHPTDRWVTQVAQPGALLAANRHRHPATPGHTRPCNTWSEGISSHVRHHLATLCDRLILKQVHRAVESSDGEPIRVGHGVGRDRGDGTASGPAARLRVRSSAAPTAGCASGWDLARLVVGCCRQCGRRVRLLPPDQRPGRCAARTSGQAASAVSLTARVREHCYESLPAPMLGK
jgi:hypothetical protein